MTEEKKQELRQLLQEAMSSLEIRLLSKKNTLLLPVDVYKEHLQQSWGSLVNYDPCVVNEDTKSRLFDFIRKEFRLFIHEDRIQSASSFIKEDFSKEFSLDRLLDQLLRIAIVHGIEGAVSAVDRCTEETQVSFQVLALLEGIRVKSKMQVFEGIQLVPLSISTQGLPRSLLNLVNHSRTMSENSFIGKTLLIIDCSVSPIFHKPFPELIMQEYEENDTFQVEVNGDKFADAYMADFSEIFFSQALSLACNSAVQIAFKSKFIADDELFNLSYRMNSFTQSRGPFGDAVEVGQSHIEKAKDLYNRRTKLNSETQKKLKVPIDRWIKSHTYQHPVDKMIDLGIALESLYVSGNRKVSYQLRHNASRYLSTDKVSPEQLKAELKIIYGCRCDAVHEGELKKSVTIDGEAIPMSEFITKAQKLCRDTIMKILKKGEFPDWSNLMPG